MIFGGTLFPIQSPLQIGKIKALMIAAGMRGKAGLAMEIMMMGLYLTRHYPYILGQRLALKIFLSLKAPLLALTMMMDLLLILMVMR